MVQKVVLMMHTGIPAIRDCCNLGVTTTATSQTPSVELQCIQYYVVVLEAALAIAGCDHFSVVV